LVAPEMAATKTNGLFAYFPSLPADTGQKRKTVFISKPIYLNPQINSTRSLQTTTSELNLSTPNNPKNDCPTSSSRLQFPVLKVSNQPIVSDENKNGVVEPGEKFTITAMVKNIGNYSAFNIKPIHNYKGGIFNPVALSNNPYIDVLKPGEEAPMMISYVAFTTLPKESSLKGFLNLSFKECSGKYNSDTSLVNIDYSPQKIEIMISALEPDPNDISTHYTTQEFDVHFDVKNISTTPLNDLFFGYILNNPDVGVVSSIPPIGTSWSLSPGETRTQKLKLQIWTNSLNAALPLELHLKNKADQILLKKKSDLIINYKLEVVQMPKPTEVPNSKEQFKQPATLPVEVANETNGSINRNSVNSQETKMETPQLISIVDTGIPRCKNQFDQHTYALIIGNEDYVKYQTDLTSEANVHFAVNDAKTFKKYLEQMYGIQEENTFYLENATASQMKQGINRLAKLIDAERGKAKVIVYYAGHGLPSEPAKIPHLVPVDVSGTNVEDGIELPWMYQRLTEFPSQRILVFLDACFSGGARGQQLIAYRGVKIKPESVELSGNIVVFSSSSNDQSSLVWKEKGHGLFTYHLLNKLKESKGEVPLSELSEHLRDQVNLSAIKKFSRNQTPTVDFPEKIDKGLLENIFLNR
jgi:hypothetical protein